MSLPKARFTLQENMAAGKKSRDNLIYSITLAVDDLLNLETETIS
jgi:hypothetical protein